MTDHPSSPGGLGDIALTPAAVQEGDTKEKGRQALTFSTNTGRMLIDTIDFPTFVNTMITIILDTCRGDLPHNDGVQIVDYALQLLVNSIISKPSLLQDFYNWGSETRKQDKTTGVTITLPEGHAQPEYSPQAANITPIEDFILNVTLAHHEQRIRAAASANFHQLCSR